MRRDIFCWVWLCLVVLPAGLAGAADVPRGGRFKAERLTLPTFGVSCVAPAGWLRAPESKASHIFRWVRLNKSKTAIDCLIEGRIGLLYEPTLNKFAANMASRARGRVSEEKTTLGGAEALEIVAGRRRKAVSPLQAVVLRRGKLFYALTLHGTDPKQGAAEFESVRKSWLWVPLESPAKHLALAERPQMLFDGLAKLKLPNPMRFYRADEGEGKLTLLLYDYTRPAAVFRMQVYSQDKAAKTPPQSVVNGHSAVFRGNHKLDRPYAWTTLKGAPYRCVGEALPVAESWDLYALRDPNIRVCYGFAFPTPTKVLFFTFDCRPAKLADAGPYLALPEQIMATLKAPATPQPRGKK